jgi:hypothetical protein
MPTAQPERLAGREIWKWREAVSADGCLRPAARLIALRLSFHADKITGECWPSQLTLAREVAMHRSRVQGHVGAIIERGWLELAREPRRGCVSRYRLRMAEVDYAGRPLANQEVDYPDGHDLPTQADTSGLPRRAQSVQSFSRSEGLITGSRAVASAPALPPAQPTTTEHADGSITVRMRMPTWSPK